MCVTNDQLQKRSRWQRAVANFALVAGLLLWNFGRTAGKPFAPWFDATVGLLMGMSIGMNLLLAVRSRRCRQNATQS